MDRRRVIRDAPRPHREATTEESERLTRPRQQRLTLQLVYAGAQRVFETQPRLLAEAATVVGRVSEDPSSIYLEDRRVSRVHAVVTVTAANQLHICDAGSRNGTFVNGQRISQCIADVGSVLRVGDSLFVLGTDQAPPYDVSHPAILGTSPRTRMLRFELHQAARSGAPVLLCGESGTGKELAAQVIHEWSERSGPIVAVNCAAIPESLAESQLFGHVAGAFTSAVAQPGYFRAAQRGSLFLDEIGEMPLSLQPKLLRIVEDGQLSPIGSVTASAVDVRLICATNRDLEKEVSEGRFRGDLLSRISAVTVRLPPLRERRSDILLLLRNALPADSTVLTAGLAEAILCSQWRLNVRELFNLGTRLSMPYCDAQAIEAELREKLAATTPPGAEPLPIKETPTKSRLDELLHRHRGNVAAVARELNSTRKHVYRWIGERQIDLLSYRGSESP